MSYQPDEYKHVNYLWDDAVADKLDPVENLVYRSNKLGEDQRITNTGGGNTSAKGTATDPVTGQRQQQLEARRPVDAARPARAQRVGDHRVADVLAFRQSGHKH